MEAFKKTIKAFLEEEKYALDVQRTMSVQNDNCAQEFLLKAENDITKVQMINGSIVDNTKPRECIETVDETRKKEAPLSSNLCFSPIKLDFSYGPPISTKV